MTADVLKALAIVALRTSVTLVYWLIFVKRCLVNGKGLFGYNNRDSRVGSNFRHVSPNGIFNQTWQPILERWIQWDAL